MSDLGKLTVTFADGKKFEVTPPSVEEFDKWLAREQVIHGEYKVAPEKMVDAPVLSRLQAVGDVVKAGIGGAARGGGLLQGGASLGVADQLARGSGEQLLHGGRLPESQYRGISSGTGEGVGSTLGALGLGAATAPFTGPFGVLAAAATGAGIGAIGGDEAARQVQKAKGVEPSDSSRLGIFGRNALLETAGRGIFDALPAAARWLKRGGADPVRMAENIDILRAVGHPPRLDLVAQGGFWDWEGMYTWAAKNQLSKSRIDAAHQAALNDMRRRFEPIATINRMGKVQAPSTTTLGRSVERGLARFDESWHDKAKLLYDDFETAFLPKTPIKWDNLNTTLNALASENNPLLRPLVTNRVADLRGAIHQNYAIQIALPSGPPLVVRADIPFDQMKQLRSRIGEILGRVDPNPDLPREELKKIYAALSKDLRAGAEAAGPDILRKFERADTFYKMNMDATDRTLERIYKKFQEAGGSASDISKIVEGFVNGRDVDRMIDLQRALGRTSPEMDHVRKYVFREMMYPDDKDIANATPNVLYAIRRFSRMEDNMRSVLFGKKGTPSRDGMEQILEVWRRMPGFGTAPVRAYSRFTQAEVLGPLSMGSVITGGTVGGATRSIPAGLLAFAAMATMTPLYASRLLLNPDVITKLARGMRGDALELAPMITRLVGDAALMDDADQAAIAQFAAGLSGILNPENQQQPAVNPAALTQWQGR